MVNEFGRLKFPNNYGFYAIDYLFKAHNNNHKIMSVVAAVRQNIFANSTSIDDRIDFSASCRLACRFCECVWSGAI